jgi:undecaprenyl-phosphate 4-deoxy-4-formamido-L-arabinose transferase
VQTIASAREVSTFIPALGYTFAHNPTEVEVAHAERAAGESKYSMYRLVRLNFDLITGFSLVPLQLFSVAGMIVALTSVVLYVVVIVQRALIAGFVEGMKAAWDRDILEFFLIGCIMFGLGLLGEYVGRIYHQVRDRPRYVIRAVLERGPDVAEPAHAPVEGVRLIR